MTSAYYYVRKEPTNRVNTGNNWLNFSFCHAVINASGIECLFIGRMTEPDCAVMCHLINIHTRTHTYIHFTYIHHIIYMHTYTGQEESHFHKDSTTTAINPKPRSIGKRTTPTTKHYHLINLTSYIAYVL